MSLSIRQATSEEDGLIADNFYLMWQDYDMHTILEENWKEKTLEFISEARAKHQYMGFIAEQNGEIVASAACQLFQGLYPIIFQEDKRKYGYIWGVYVNPAARGQKIATKITRACNNYLKGIGCSKVMLHASPMGKGVYEKLDFVTSNEMIMEFK